MVSECFLSHFVVIALELKLPDCCSVFSLHFSTVVFFSSDLRHAQCFFPKILIVVVFIRECSFVIFADSCSFYIPEFFHYFSESSVLLIVQVNEISQFRSWVGQLLSNLLDFDCVGRSCRNFPDMALRIIPESIYAKQILHCVVA